MVTFESDLQKLKCEILKEVASLAKEGNISRRTLETVPYVIIQGEKPKYRCCVYHERAIVKERAKIAAGYLPNGDRLGEWEKAKNNSQVMFIIEGACDRCPINKYTITEACRGCLQHKCMEACNCNAITRINGRAYIDQDACIECGLCKASCPYNAISEVMRPCRNACPTGALEIQKEDRRAIINSENCTNCGACMSACPFGAISDKSYIVPVINKIKEGKKVYAIVAPAITGQLGINVTVGQVKSALKNVGFENMMEVACGADAVTEHEAMEFVERMKNGDSYMTSSCCPGFVSYIENKFPDQADRMSHTVSPMIATGRLIKKNDKDAIVVFVGPCTAKKTEISRKSINDAIDYVLTFEEIAAILDAYEIDPKQCEDVEVNDASAFGRGFAQGGGLSAAVEDYIKSKNIEVEFNPVKISGFSNLRKFMLLAKNGKLPGNFFEGMMCEGGCIGGAGTICSQKKSKVPLANFSKAAKSEHVISNEKLAEFEGIKLERKF